MREGKGSGSGRYAPRDRELPPPTHQQSQVSPFAPVHPGAPVHPCTSWFPAGFSNCRAAARRWPARRSAPGPFCDAARRRAAARPPQARAHTPTRRTRLAALAPVAPKSHTCNLTTSPHASPHEPSTQCLKL